MDEHTLLNQLENLTVRKNDQATDVPLDVLQNLIGIAQFYQLQGLHWNSIKLLNRAKQIIAPLNNLDAVLANCMGGRVELILQWADRLAVPPPPELLATLEIDLNRAITLDARNPSLFWDQAVIQARFRGNYTDALNYLNEALSLGFQHPMLSRLLALMQAAPPVSTLPPDSEMRLRQLLLQIAVQVTGPDAWQFDSQIAAGRERPIGALSTMEDYQLEATRTIEAGNLSEAGYLAIMEACEQIFSGDAAEAVADLLRRISEISGSDVFHKRATTRHILLLIQMAFQLFPNDRKDAAAIRRSLKAANRGLDIINDTDADTDPNWHAELLLARGQALYYQEPSNTAEAIRCYHQAIILKQEAGQADDVTRLKGLLRTQIHHRVGRGIVSTLIGGIGESIEVLQACVEAAGDLGDPAYELNIRLNLAMLKRQVGQYAEAEEMLNDILKSSTPEEIIRGAMFELASVFSETSRPREAANLQKYLLDTGSAKESMLWSNYANSLMLLNELDEALVALDNAWNLLPPEQKTKIGNVLPTDGAHNRMLVAQVLLKKGLPEAAIKEMIVAADLNESPIGIDGLYFYRIQASVQLALGRYDEAIDSLERAHHLMTLLLSQGPSLPSWESMLYQWSELDIGVVRAILHSEAEDRAEKAMLRAEAAKGRIYAWLENILEPTSAEYALSMDRQVQSLKLARQWLAVKDKRQLIALFASPQGLGIFSLGFDGRISAAWLEDVNYDEFIQDCYDPWEKLSERALTENVEPELLALVNSQTDYLLDLVGTWLWRAQPLLDQGGSDLVIIPHRALRSIPLAHARMPFGKRLSDLFETITILPTLGDLARRPNSLDVPINAASVNALADADGSLVFARCEALLAGTGHNLSIGQEVTDQTLQESFGREGLTLLSLHGDFDEDNPYRSRIFVHEGEVELNSLMFGQAHIRNQVVVLGVCEAGRSRRSVSDEPIGFPATFIQGGTRVVLAPAWRVDDFISFLFITMLFDELSQETSIYRAYLKATRWLRELTVQQALKRIDALTVRVLKAAAQTGSPIDEFELRISDQRTWLENQKPETKVFRSPLDWSAFQLTGSLPVS